MIALFSAATSTTEKARASVDQLCQPGLGAWDPPVEDRMMCSGYSIAPHYPPELE
jgi:hypothetical protein